MQRATGIVAEFHERRLGLHFSPLCATACRKQCMCHRLRLALLAASSGTLSKYLSCWLETLMVVPRRRFHILRRCGGPGRGLSPSRAAEVEFAAPPKLRGQQRVLEELRQAQVGPKGLRLELPDQLELGQPPIAADVVQKRLLKQERPPLRARPIRAGRPVAAGRRSPRRNRPTSDTASCRSCRRRTARSPRSAGPFPGDPTAPAAGAGWA